MEVFRKTLRILIESGPQTSIYLPYILPYTTKNIKAFGLKYLKQTSINIKLGAGDYELEDEAGYIWKKSVHEGQKNELVQSEFIVNKQKTKGNIIKGTVQVNNKDGYLITSIPYDKNFEILVDGKKAAYEKVNTAFLGLKIQEGKHEVEIIYHAPGLMLGKILSLIGIILFVLIIRLK